MRVMALDVGTVRIGVAVSDELGFAAHPHSTITRVSLKHDLRAIADIAVETGAVRILIGKPINMNGSEGPMVELVEQFAIKLADFSPVPIELIDERLTTASAERALIASDVRRDKRKQVRDQVAACFILESWLMMHQPSHEEFD